VRRTRPERVAPGQQQGWRLRAAIHTGHVMQRSLSHVRLCADWDDTAAHLSRPRGEPAALGHLRSPSPNPACSSGVRAHAQAQQSKTKERTH
jgi:hypothetical protein